MGMIAGIGQGFAMLKTRRMSDPRITLELYGSFTICSRQCLSEGLEEGNHMIQIDNAEAEGCLCLHRVDVNSNFQPSLQLMLQCFGAPPCGQATDHGIQFLFIAECRQARSSPPQHAPLHPQRKRIRNTTRVSDQSLSKGGSQESSPASQLQRHCPVS